VRASGRPVALELFSGTGHFSSAWRRGHKTKHIDILELDLCHGEHNDLMLPKVRHKIAGWISNQLVCCVWMGTPCSSWSRARDRPGLAPPLRSNQCLMGLPNLKPHDAKKVHVGNVLMKASAYILHLCSRHAVPAAIENPSTSRIWLARPLVQAQRWQAAREILLDFCQYGTPWRKRTKILCVHANLLPASKLCTGRKTCSATGVPHVQLAGIHNEEFRTLTAQPYPKPLCRELCHHFASALATMKFNKISRYLRP